MFFFAFLLSLWHPESITAPYSWTNQCPLKYLQNCPTFLGIPFGPKAFLFFNFVIAPSSVAIFLSYFFNGLLRTHSYSIMYFLTTLTHILWAFPFYLWHTGAFKLNQLLLLTGPPINDHSNILKCSKKFKNTILSQGLFLYFVIATLFLLFCNLNCPIVCKPSNLPRFINHN